MISTYLLFIIFKFVITCDILQNTVQHINRHNRFYIHKMLSFFVLRKQTTHLRHFCFSQYSSLINMIKYHPVNFIGFVTFDAEDLGAFPTAKFIIICCVSFNWNCNTDILLPFTSLNTIFPFIKVI